KTPIKEKPADPGGMQFPNQDKTIFDTFNGNATPTAQNVERILPSPEEPMSKDLDTSETSTWINNKLTKGGKAAPAEKILSVKDEPATAPTGKSESKHQVIPVSSPDEDESETYVSPKVKPTQVLDNAVKSAGLSEAE